MPPSFLVAATSWLSVAPAWQQASADRPDSRRRRSIRFPIVAGSTEHHSQPPKTEFLDICSPTARPCSWVAFLTTKLSHFSLMVHGRLASPCIIRGRSRMYYRSQAMAFLLLEEIPSTPT